jgi:hypothetical protein
LIQVAILRATEHHYTVEAKFEDRRPFQLTQSFFRGWCRQCSGPLKAIRIVAHCGRDAVISERASSQPPGQIQGPAHPVS